MIGIAYRRPLASWIATRPPKIECIEITAEHFYDGDHDTLRNLAQNYTLFVHGLGLSLGTPGPLDEEQLRRFAEVVAIAQPAWISEHVAFTRTGETDFGHLNPVRPTRKMARIVADHARQLSDYCGRPLILENITSHLQISGELSEADFLNELCEHGDCGLLLDVTNLYINSRNHHFDPLAWLHIIKPFLIRQLHLFGYSREDNWFNDGHAEPIQEELLELAREVVAYAQVKAIILERDENFPAPATLAAELAKLETIRGRN
jgi:hypothetical protein